MIVSHRFYGGGQAPQTAMKLEPELNRLSVAFRSLLSELREADRRGMSLYRIRLMKKYDQIWSRISRRLMALGHNEDTVNLFLADLERQAMKGEN